MHGDVERADVDAQLQRVGRHHGAHRAFAQALLDLATPVRQIAAAIPPDPFGRARQAVEVVLQIRRQDLGREPALREHDELQVALQEFGRDAPRLAQVRPADARAAGSRRAGSRRRRTSRRAAPRSCRPARTVARSAVRPARADSRSSPTSRGTPGSSRSGGRCAAVAAARCTDGCRTRRDRRAARR